MNERELFEQAAARAKKINRMNYFEHLRLNWRVAFHAMFDFFAHFIHGLIPCIKIRHHQPVRGASQNKGGE